MSIPTWRHLLERNNALNTSDKHWAWYACCLSQWRKVKNYLKLIYFYLILNWGCAGGVSADVETHKLPIKTWDLPIRYIFDYAITDGLRETIEEAIEKIEFE